MQAASHKRPGDPAPRWRNAGPRDDAGMRICARPAREASAPKEAPHEMRPQLHVFLDKKPRPQQVRCERGLSGAIQVLEDQPCPELEFPRIES